MEAGLFQEIDHLRGVSEPIMTGVNIPTGTGSVEVQLDESIFNSVYNKDNVESNCLDYDEDEDGNGDENGHGDEYFDDDDDEEEENDCGEYRQLRNARSENIKSVFAKYAGLKEEEEEQEQKGETANVGTDNNNGLNASSELPTSENPGNFNRLDNAKTLATNFLEMIAKKYKFE